MIFYSNLNENTDKDSSSKTSPAKTSARSSYENDALNLSIQDFQNVHNSNYPSN